MGEKVTMDTFKWLISILWGVVSGVVMFQQNQISLLNGKLQTYQDSVYPVLSNIKVDIATINANLGFIKEQLGSAEITK